MGEGEVVVEHDVSDARQVGTLLRRQQLRSHLGEGAGGGGIGTL